MNEVDVHVGRRIRQRRQRHGISIELLAGATGIDTVSMAACEAGTRRGSACELPMICQTLDMRAADLFQRYVESIC